VSVCRTPAFEVEGPDTDGAIARVYKNQLLQAVGIPLLNDDQMVIEEETFKWPDVIIAQALRQEEFFHPSGLFAIQASLEIQEVFQDILKHF